MSCDQIGVLYTGKYANESSKTVNLALLKYSGDDGEQEGTKCMQADTQ